MDVIWNQTRMQGLLNSFFTLIKIRVGFFDLEGREIVAYPPVKSDFCNLIRGTPDGESACKRCDREVFSKARDHHGPHIYQCHTGLTLRLDEVRSCANILQALANYVWLDHYIRVQNEPLSGRVKAWIAGNTCGDLSLAGITRQFGVGKTTLCKAVKRDFGLTVNELIRTTRIERAKQLLRSGSQPVAEIAEAVGIPDYNYFTKVFKEEIGVPPSMFRKLCEAGQRTAFRGFSSFRVRG